MEKNMNEYGKCLEKNIAVDSTKSLSYKIKNKKVYLEKTICDFSDLSKVSANYELQKLQKGVSFKYNTYIKDISKGRNHPNIIINFEDLDLSEYNLFNVRMMFKCIGFKNFYIHLSIYNNNEEITHTHSAICNEMTDIMWELNKYSLTNVNKMVILIFVMGTPPEALSEVEVILDSITVKKVNGEYEHGWDLGNNICYSHTGYLINKDKKALMSAFEAVSPCLYDQDNKKVYDIKYKKDGTLIELDFTEFNKEGLYKIKDESSNVETGYFIIGEDIYNEVIYKSLNFLHSLRCGEDVDDVHTACHLYSKTIHPITKATVPNFGGWHDAGDLSQFEIPTAEMTSSLCDLASVIKDEELKKRIIDEAKVGANWLLRTRFGDGYRANTVLYRTWHSNVILDNDQSISDNIAEEGPFENFISAEALIKMASITDVEEFKVWCERSAIEDFLFGVYEYDNGIYTKRWGKSIDSQAIGAMLTAGANIYKYTQDEKYLDILKKYYHKVLDTQEVDVTKEIYGYFYEDKEHKYILSYEHRGHEQSPIVGVIDYYTVCKDEKIKQELKKSMEYYRDYILKSTYLKTNKYGLLPAGVYNINKINVEHFTTYGYTVEKALEVLKGQVITGKKITDEVYLRNFPISLSRRGFHATLLSKTKGVSYLGLVLNDKDLEQIAINQIEWVLGYNPFNTSSMYGFGDNYHPLYVAFSKQMVGALPVGFMTYKDDDAPYWPVKNNAVYKEIWGHTSGKFIWVLKDILEMENKNE